MRFLYSIKGCSHCDLRESCDLKNHKANLAETMRSVRDDKDIRKTWWTQCKDFFREVRGSTPSARDKDE